MSFPQIIDYNEAVQDTASAFTDPVLRGGRVAETGLGLPLALSGGFALTYEIAAGGRKYAVRCFHRQVPEVQARYQAVSTALKRLANSYFVDFDFQPNGITVRGQKHPIVKMDWVEGETLGVHLDRVASNPSEIHALRQASSDLAGFLESHGVAHGDIQNENVMVSGRALRLIDYDGMFVPGMATGNGSEVGHKHFQHPGRGVRDFGPAMDRFSFIVLDVSFEALMADPALHRKFREGGQAIIFKANDFSDPTTSEVFRLLDGLPAVRDSARKLAAVCQAPLSAVPTLTDFIAGRNIPAVAAKTATAEQAAKVVGYISAFPVVDGANFAMAMAAVGEKVEIVGKILSVREGITKRGKRKNRPYVFINFGLWNGQNVKITIWSEGLGAMSTRPTAAWASRWISVTGLVEPPYEGRHYDKSYTSVGITVVSDNQIILLPEKEAKFRLAQPAIGGQSREGRAGSNQDILRSIRNPRGAPAPSRAPAPTAFAAKPSTKNEAILASLRQSAPASIATGSPLGSTGSQAPQRTQKGIPWWIWALGVLIVLAWLNW
ncbi:hypothetical protein [Caulobacter sp. LARHSG274]